MSQQTARVAVSILRTVVTGGTGTRANPGKWPVFGKTGTTQDYTDAWFVGSTRQLSAAVWMGSPERNVPMRSVGSVGRVFGGTYPARIFSLFMKNAMHGRPALNFPLPDPKQIGNKQLSLTTLPNHNTTTSGVTLDEPGTTVPDDVFGDDPDPPDRPPRHTTTTHPQEPPPTAGCEEPDNWPDDYPPFCS